MSSRPIHALHIFPTFATGGQQVRFTAIANHLTSDLRHTIVAIDGNYEASRLLSPQVSFGIATPAPSKNSLLAPFYYSRLVSSIAPDVVQTYNWGAMDAVLGALAAGQCPILHTEDGFNSDESARLKWRRLIIRRVLLSRIRATIVPSQTLYEIARARFGLRPAKIKLIPNGVDTRRFSPHRNSVLRTQLGIKEHEIVIGTAARFSPEKNLLQLITAFHAAKLDNAWLILAGEGPCGPALREAARRSGAGHRVIFTGLVSDTAPLYGAFDIFAMSSLTEQMPMALLEAMSSGLPAVCTSVGDTQAILQTSGPPEVIPGGAPGSLGAALRELATCPATRQKIGAKNRLLCERNYSIETMVNSYLTLYRSSSRRVINRAIAQSGDQPLSSASQR